jgi:2,5-diketo-D-gluconate reductase A
MTADRRQPTVALDRAGAMPLVGLGTWQMRGARCQAAVRAALEVGYRHIDTATIYGNEREVGRAVRDSGVPREQVFVTTKLPPGNAGRERRTLTESRAVGVSNYSPARLDELIDATGQAPQVNQIPWAPALHDAALLDAHRRRGVVLEGYSPFKNTDLRHPVLADIAARHGVTPAQVVVRWHVDHQVVVIPKSANPGRIAANFDVFGFSLGDEELGRIDGLSTGRRR